MQLDQAEITEKELELLGKNLEDLDAQLDLTGETSAGNLAMKPQWIADKVIYSIRLVPAILWLEFCHTCSRGTKLSECRRKLQR